MQDLQTYCSQKSRTLSDAKAKAYDLIRAIGAVPEPDPGLTSELERLRGLIDDMDDRLEYLSRECPAEWTEEKNLLDQKMQTTREGLERVARQVKDLVPDSISWI
ncbi:MAG: hypothetical protein ACOC9D_06855 [Thermodesulfobacteriota bacterium]